jgi:hypothetical protein
VEQVRVALLKLYAEQNENVPVTISPFLAHLLRNKKNVPERRENVPFVPKNVPPDVPEQKEHPPKMSYLYHLFRAMALKERHRWRANFWSSRRMLKVRCLKMERNDKGQFVLGHNGGPGRPKGSRNQLAEAMIADLYADWCEHGAEAIRQVREERPADYLKVVALLVSKCDDLSLADDMRDAAVEEIIEERRQKALALIEKMREGE